MKNIILKYSSSYLNDLNEIVQSLDEFQPEIEKISVFITGGTGFIGRWLVDSFLMLGAKVTVLTRNREQAFQMNLHWRDAPGLELIEGDLSSVANLSGEFDIIIHAAHELGTSLLDSFQYAKDLFQFSRRAKCAQFLFLSSGAVYQCAKMQPSHFLEAEELDENLESASAYAAAKISIEREGNQCASRGDFQFKSARIFSVLGPHQNLNAHYAVSNFFNALITGKEIEIKGDGQSRRSYLYPTDLMRGLFLVLLRGKAGRAYNLGSDEEVTILELSKLINEKRAGPIREVKLLNEETTSLSQSDHYIPSLNLILAELSFKPKVNLRDAIARTCKFYREVFSNSNIRA